MQKLILEKSSPFHLKLWVLFRFSLRARIRTSSDVIKMYLMGCDERYRAILPHAFRLEEPGFGNGINNRAFRHRGIRTIYYNIIKEMSGTTSQPSLRCIYTLAFPEFLEAEIFYIYLVLCCWRVICCYNIFFL